MRFENKFLGMLAGALSLALLSIAVPVMAATTVSVGAAYNGGPDLVQLIAFKKAAARGVDVKVDWIKSDDTLFQAVLSGQIDIGVGDAYAGIANAHAPLTNIYSIRRLAYVPVVDKTVYPDWKALNGHVMTVQSRGSGTEALALFAAKQHGIKYSRVSYLSGSATRLVAMQRGFVKASYLDLPNAQKLISGDAKRFGRLPSDAGDKVSDSTMYLRKDYLAKHGKAVQILLEELVKAARKTAADPTYPARERKALGLLPDLDKKDVAAITPYYQEADKLDIFPTSGGGEASAKADIAFLHQAGRLSDKDSSNPSDYWTFGPLNAALKAVASQSN